MVDQSDAWGAPERHYSGEKLPGFHNAVSMGWEESLKRVAPRCEQEVRRHVGLWNQRVRNRLAAETGFQLRGREVPIEIASGLPPPLAEKLADRVGVEAIMLNRPLLQAVADGTKFMAETREVVENAAATRLGDAGPDDLDRVRDTATAWLQWADDNDVSKLFAEIREDLFGAYWYPQQRVLIYWLPIGIYAVRHNISIDAMTVVVLAHELAHAYTHMGYDIDGLDWPTAAFGGTDIAVIEGLAQFYAYSTCLELVRHLPEAVEVFQALLDCQHSIYRTHETWMEEAGTHSREVVRTGMVECRRAQEPLDRDQFAKKIKAAATRFTAPPAG